MTSLAGALLLAALAACFVAPLRASDLELPFQHTDDIGPFLMRWGFEGSGTNESIIISFSLPSDIFVGIGFGCTSSAQCDMVVGNGGGNNPVFLTDYYEVHGDSVPNTDVELGGRDDVELLGATWVNYESTLRFRRLLDTGDQYDYKLSKGLTDIVYAWCAEPFCTAKDTSHAPGDWNIIQVDLSGGGGGNSGSSSSSSSSNSSNTLAK
eukprot:g1221.t1